METTIAVVTEDQLSLIKRTIATGATDEELALFFYDCRRHGVHPLDRMIHFTKRKGKYTPITSIDLMRARAAETGEMAGSDDAAFTIVPSGEATAATVTVYRLTQGQRFPYTATARWSEYYPGDGDVGFMWRKMRQTMLAKCAEALALRKAFPKQLQGLYAREEMDQAGAVTMEPVQAGVTTLEPVPATTSTYRAEDGSVRVVSVEEMSGSKPTGKGTWTKWAITFDDGQSYSTFTKHLAEDCRKLQAAGTRVIPMTATQGAYTNLIDLKLPDGTLGSAQASGADAMPEGDRPETVAAIRSLSDRHAFTDAERMTITQTILKGQTMGKAALRDLTNLRAFLEDAQAVKDWRAEVKALAERPAEIPF